MSFPQTPDSYDATHFFLFPAGNNCVLPQRAARDVSIRRKSARAARPGLAESGADSAGDVAGAFLAALLSSRRCADVQSTDSKPENTR